MFSPLPSGYVRSEDVTSTDITPTNYITIYTKSNESERVVRQEIKITVNVPVIEFEHCEPPPKPKLLMKPLTPVRKAPWQAKWRLTQQRPRDGLHS